jgi:glycosyltransferase involved in cell wall biosynthesis
MSTPVLSICVPTFTREASLAKLLRNLEEVVRAGAGDIELCVSDNASEDNTQAVVAEFAAQYPITYVRQPTNIGATRNLIAVSGMASGRWGVLVGDDDLVNRDVALDLVALLKQSGDSDWILIDAAHGDQVETYFSRISAGRHTAREFRRPLLSEGMQPLGFMGVHVFPPSAFGSIAGLSMGQLRPWPHIAAFLRFIARRDAMVTVVRKPLIHQAGGAESLFWNAADLARMRMDKVRIIGEVRGGALPFRLYLCTLMIREAYRRDIIAALVSWRIYEPESFRREGLSEVGRRVAALGALGPILLPHLILVGLLTLLPTAIMDVALRLLGHGHKRRVYIETKERIGQHDAVKRGL